MVAVRTWHRRVKPVIPLSGIHLHSRCREEIVREASMLACGNCLLFCIACHYSIRYHTNIPIKTRADLIGPC